MVSKEMLAKPFDGSIIKQRPGTGRTMFDYVSGADILSRVIEATENEYDWTIQLAELVTAGGQPLWFVRGNLTVPGLGSRDGIGTHPAESVDAAKAAETDAFKRAAVKFAIALHLYETENGSVPPDDETPKQTSRSRKPRSHIVNGSECSCPDCFAPAGKPHASGCPSRAVLNGR